MDGIISPRAGLGRFKGSGKLNFDWRKSRREREREVKGKNERLVGPDASYDF